MVTGWVPLVVACLAVATDPGQRDADARILKAAGLAADGPTLLNYFRQRTVPEADRGRILALIHQLGDETFARREEASAQLETFGLAAVGLLRQAERNIDIEVVRRSQRCLSRIEKVPTTALSAASARELARLKPPGTAAVLLAYLPTADDESVADEVRSALAAVGDDPAIVAALTDPLSVRRAAAAEALIRAGISEKARNLSRDPDVEVRLRVALALVTVAREKEALRSLVDLLAELPQGFGWRVEEVLCRLAGDTAPQVSLGTDEASRRACRDAWSAWLNRHGPGLDLAKLDAATTFLGYTLVVSIHNGGAGGSIVELAADGKERWKLTGLQTPLDAQVLSNGRVLVAEHNGHRVTERDLTGKVVWEKRVMMPMACTRLANGATFIAARNRLMEVNRDGSDAAVIQRPQSDIVAAVRRPNGGVIFLTNIGNCVSVDTTGKELKSFSVGRVNYHSTLDLLPNGRVLLTQQNAVAEFDLETGRSVWQAAVSQPTGVQRLPNGNTLVTCLDAARGSTKVMELDRSGKTVWEYRQNDPQYRPWKARRR